jgi:hypothetical protein
MSIMRANHIRISLPRQCSRNGCLAQCIGLGDDATQVWKASANRPMKTALTLVPDLNVADEPPRPNLELGTLACLHANAVIPEECGPARGHSGTGRDTEPDVSDQVEDAKDRSRGRSSISQVHPHVADEHHDLLIGPSGPKGTLCHITEEREHRWSRRRRSRLPRPVHPEPPDR